MRRTRLSRRTIAAAVVLVASFVAGGAAYRLLEAQIAARVDTAAALSDRLRDDGLVLARAADVDMRLRRVRSRVRPFDTTVDDAQNVAQFVRLAATDAAREGATVDAVTAAAQAGAAFRAAGVSPHSAVAPALDITLRGSYGALLRAMRALAGAPIVADIDITSIERPPGQNGDGRLTARFRAVLQRAPDLLSPAFDFAGEKHDNTGRP